MAEGFGNFFTAELAGSIDTDDTSVTVDDATGIPPAPFRAVIQDGVSDPTNREIVVVSAASGTTLTLVRAREGTSGASHAGGSFLANVATATTLGMISRPTPLAAAVPDSVPGAAAANFTPAASSAYMAPISLPSVMRVQALKVRVATAGSGTVQWGLFEWHEFEDLSALSAPKVAGGSAALNGTGWRAISSSPEGQEVRPGPHFLIVHFPASNIPVVQSSSTGAGTGSAGIWRVATGYSWDDTPDLTAFGWTQEQLVMFLHGHLGRAGFTVDW